MSRKPSPNPAQSGVLFDELLVVLAQQGDKQAFERLYARWNARLLRAARRYTGDSDLARDLAQDCWIGIWKGIGRLSSPAQFRSYAFAVLHRRGSDAIAKAIRTRAQTSDVAPQEQSTPASQDEKSTLVSAFESLPPDQRLAAHLHFVEGLTLAEIAHVQAIPLGTAKTRLFHARRKLKTALAD
ncbi:MAG: RNA polymerase sigma factor [Pseudomonadota bacterium]